jgi:hypothetical protein
MMKKIFSALPVIFLFMLSFLMESCKPGVPREYIQPDDMEDILFDYSLADGITKSQDSKDTIQLRVLRIAILKKYKVTEAEMDSSMIYYLRHTEQMQKIYENLADRLSREARAQGISGSEINSSAGAMIGDTTNIWTGDRAIVLSQYKPFNVQSYSFVADSSYHKGDNIILEFATNFISQSGVQDGVVVLAVTFNNDSVANQTMHVSSSSNYHLQVMDESRCGIKWVKGYFLFNNSQNMQDNQMSSNDMKMLLVYNIRLVKMHETKEQKLRNDSIRKASSQIDTSAANHSQPTGSPQRMPLPNGPIQTMPITRQIRP